MDYLQYAKAFNSRQEVLNWIGSTLKNYLAKNPEIQDEIEHIIDYISSDAAPKNIAGMAYDEAKNNAEKWLKAQAKKGEHIKETAADTEIVLDFKDGFKIVKLVGENAYKREGFLVSSGIIIILISVFFIGRASEPLPPYPFCVNGTEVQVCFKSQYQAEQYVATDSYVEYNLQSQSQNINYTNFVVHFL